MVRFKEFFLGDILTSMVRPLIDVYFIGCFFTSDEWKDPALTGQCKPTHSIVLIVSLIPFHIRFWQCINRFYYTQMWFPHLVNAGKYMATIILLIVAYYRNTYKSYEALFIGMSIFATLYSYIWDITMDWGLLRGTHEGNRLLRDRMKFPKRMYYFSMITNLILRFSWTLTLIPSSFFPQFFVETDGLFFLLGLGEAYRRAQWSLFRVENENVNNFEKYRAIMEIPKLPDEQYPEKSSISVTF